MFVPYVYLIVVLFSCLWRFSISILACSVSITTDQLIMVPSFLVLKRICCTVYRASTYFGLSMHAHSVLPSHPLGEENQILAKKLTTALSGQATAAYPAKTEKS